jgi:hypothetical protein
LPWSRSAHAKRQLESVEHQISSMAAMDWRRGDESNKTKGIEEMTSLRIDAVLREQRHVMDMVKAVMKAEEADRVHEQRMTNEIYRKAYEKHTGQAGKRKRPKGFYVVM